MNLKQFLCEYQKNTELKKEKITKKYLKLKFNIYDIFDENTGSVYLKDIDTVLLKKENPKHIIFKVFDIDCANKDRIYTCNLNDRVLLRGPQNYYYGFCYTNDLDLTIKEVTNSMKYVMQFIKKAVQFSYNDFSNKNILDLKFILAILDIVRNSVITNLFLYLMDENNIYDLYVYNENNNEIANKLYNYLTKIENKIIQITENNKNLDIKDLLIEYLKIQNEVINETKKNANKFERDLYIRFRKNREADNVLENILCIKYAVDDIVKCRSNELKKNNIYLIGINYGSIELVNILSILLKNKGINCYSANIMKKFRTVFIESTNKQKYIINKSIIPNSQYIVIDENIMTGKTINNAIDFCKTKKLNLLDIIVISYPLVSRINNFNLKNSNEYIKFFKNIKGMLIKNNYSKLLKIRDDFNFPYMDSLGTFDLKKYILLKNLYKNGVYTKGSSVSRLENYYKDIFF